MRQMIWAGIFITLSLSAAANPANSANYSFEYSAAGPSGVPSQSAAYSLSNLLRTHGVAVNVVSSASYSVAPLTGSAPAVSKVANWELY